MNNSIFLPIQKLIAPRRPAWTFVIEDNMLRIQTAQFAIKWEIIDEILQNKDFECVDVVMHQMLGITIAIEYVGGT